MCRIYKAKLIFFDKYECINVLIYRNITKIQIAEIVIS